MKYSVMAETLYVMEYIVEAEDAEEAARLIEEGEYESKDIIDVEYVDVLAVQEVAE